MGNPKKFAPGEARANGKGCLKISRQDCLSFNPNKAKLCI
jgi:hypothetical protein